MIIKLCRECGKETWHNPLKKKKDEEQGYRCTYCASPVGTGPKSDKHNMFRTVQVAKARAGR